MKIIIDPRYKYNYSTYYILGLRKLLGGDILYQVAPFYQLSYRTIKEYNSGIPIVIEYNDNQCKFFIDFEDLPKIEKDRYEWCDVYAKLNVAFGDVNKYPKLLVLGPSFGVSIDSKFKVLTDCFSHYFKARQHTDVTVKHYFRDYLYSFIRRRNLEQYEKKMKVRTNYVFHASTLWYNEFAWTNTNKFRGEFLKACKKAGLIIEGGLFFIGETPAVLREMPNYGSYKNEYKDFIFESRLNIDDYIHKTKESFVVFNTPSVCGCHGWKLAEYLCMGKAIISTPLTREMPGDGLIHGKNIHFVEKTEDIYNAVCMIRDDEFYRRHLETGAREYFEKYLAPEIVIQRVLEKYNNLKLSNG